MLRFVLPALGVVLAFTLGCYILWKDSEKAATAPLLTNASSSHPAFAYVNSTEDLIFVNAPKPGASVTNTIIVSGFARGSWYSEAVFPIEVRNAKGVVIGSGQAKAGSDWMTTAFVPFMAELDLKNLYTGAATIILKRDNPSGDPSRDASLSIPVLIQ